MLWSCVGNTRTQRARAYLEHHYFTNAQNALVLRQRARAYLVTHTRTQRARAYLEHHYFTNAQNALVLRG